MTGAYSAPVFDRLVLPLLQAAPIGFQRQERMLEVIKRLAQEGIALMLASDNLKHLFAVTQRIIILYEGRVVAGRRTSESTPREIVELIVGATQ